MLEMSQANKDWLSKFFSGRNGFNWEALNSGAINEFWSSEIAGWLSILEKGHADDPICLPCLASDGSVDWYAGARTLQGSRALTDELQAFIGPSLSSFTGQPHTIDSSDPQGSALADIFEGAVFKIEGDLEKPGTVLQSTFSLYRMLVERRPKTLRAAVRPFSILRGLFDRALLAGNETEAEQLLNEMRTSGRLTSENTKFLEVRLFAGLGRWKDIVLNSQILSDLTDFSLPPKVVRDISEAFYYAYVEPFDIKGDLDACLEKLNSSSLLKLDKLFSQRHNIQHPTVIKVFLLREFLRTTVDHKYATELLDQIADEDRTTLVKEMAVILESQDKAVLGIVDVQKEADDAFLDGEYDRALLLYQELSTDASNVKNMCACAQLSGDARSARLVLDFVSELSEETRSTIDDKTRQKLEILENQAQPIPTKAPTPAEDSGTSDKHLADWLSWARWVASEADQHQAINTLKMHSQEWSVSYFAKDSKQIKEFADIIGNSSGTSEIIIREAFGDIFSAFVLDLEGPGSDFKPLYRNLLFLLATSDAVSFNDLIISTQLISSLLSSGLTTEEYRDVIEHLVMLFEDQTSPNTLDWALDNLEILVTEPCRDTEARLRLFTKVCAFAQQSAHRLSESQSYALEALHLDFSVEFPDTLKVSDDPEENTGEQKISERLSGKKIGIYTLTETAGKRAAVAIKQLAPDCKIDLNSDHECTERLSALASSADIFVFAWKSSKHQAFYCIKNHRSGDLPLLQPLGKGSASIIREVVNHA